MSNDYFTLNSIKELQPCHFIDHRLEVGDAGDMELLSRLSRRHWRPGRDLHSWPILAFLLRFGGQSLYL
ncbi:hypothetical protein RchiOBHm_Chr5g0027941 [Rosa chinensis]|uniref:Uncharacterized protein n=1 Tax=Rosa chinensis TaxID=74649 RepID=A0A2P6Q990_ROSCH|nr:hypothetical protein RchiOBHm_Chr5g0027941 [Rosa chinensis]